MNDFTSHSHGLESSTISIGNSTMSYGVTFNAGDGQVTINPDGTVILSEGLALNEAASAFWNAVKSMGIDVRKQALQDILQICEDAAAQNKKNCEESPATDLVERLIFEGARVQAMALAASIHTVIEATCK
jgi:hypothetical protein